jgi:hypothetical protein
MDAGPIDNVGRFRLRPETLAQINRAYFDLMIDQNVPRRIAESGLPLDTVFPYPPFSTPRHTQRDVQIEWLSSVRDLVFEGAEMSHCIAMYAQHIAAGKYVAYRILAPERGTLTLKPLAPGHWVIDDLRGVHNQRLSKTTLWTVAAYLNSRQNRVPPCETEGHGR